MARIRKVIKIDDTEITVKELTVDEILQVGEIITSLPGGEDDKGEVSGADDVAPDTVLPTTITSVKDILDKHLSMAVDGITMAELTKLAPSDLQKIYTAWREVNAVFFVVAQQAGLTDLLRTIKEAVQKDFLSSLVGLSRLAIPDV